MRINYYLLIGFLSLSFLAKAQSTITGTVTMEADGSPIPGVNISVKGSNTGSVTDFDGNYEITATSSDVLVFSYVGFTPQEITVGTQQSINVALAENTESLSEVVVVGYGTQRKGDITGSVSTVDSESFEDRANNSVGNILQGQAAGVQVISSSGKPSAGFNVRIRGTNSITAGSDPLYVVDGVPTTDTRSINPADIENISVLKDASSAAIYGAQGANGVVLITTKRGKTAKPTVSVDAYVGFSDVWNTLPVLNAEQYRDLMTEMGYNTDWSQYTQNNDWQNLVFETGISQNYQLSVSGNNNGSKYYVSGGMVDQKGAVRSAEAKRYNFKVNFSQEVTDWLELGTNLTYTQYSDVDVNDNQAVNQGGVLLGVLSTPPNIGIYNEDGTFTSNPFQDWENPISSTDASQREYNLQRLLGNVYAEVEFIKDLKLRTNYGIDYGNGRYDYFLDPFKTSYGRATKGISRYNTNLSNYFIWDNTLSYKTTIGDHKIDALVGSVYQKFRWENSSIERRNFASAEVTTPNAGSEIITATADKAEKANASFLGRINYDYQNKYLVTANFRADGSSNFGPQEQWGYFPSFSLGWRISNEAFMENVDAVSDLKLRAGYGIVGNDNNRHCAPLTTSPFL